MPPGALARPALFLGKAHLPFDAQLAVRTLCAADRRLAKLIDRVGPLGLQLEPGHSLFAALCSAIIYQQLNGRAAATILGRVEALAPRRPLRPAHILAASPEALRKAGLSAAKQAALLDLAERVHSRSLPTLAALATLDDEAIIERLTVVRGVGRWTVEMLLIFRLGRPDVLPVADFGVRQGFMRTFGTAALPTAAELRRRGERWRPYRSVASWYLWRAAEGL